MCALQEGRDEEAAAVMSGGGYRYRLARPVLRYALPEAAGCSSAARVAQPAEAKPGEPGGWVHS